MILEIESVQEFPVIDKKMSLAEGMKILAHRLNLSGARIQKLARDRCPMGSVKEERGSLKTFNVKCFLKSDIVFSDILHSGYHELKFLGIGRRYLINKILRSVLAGICDALDPTGQAGDFPPKSWMTTDQAERLTGMQQIAISVMKKDNAKLLQSLKVRLRRMATHVLLCIVAYISAIRKEVKKVSAKRLDMGVRRFSDLLCEYKDRFDYKVRKEDHKNRRKAVKRRRKKRYMLFKSKKHYSGTNRLRNALKKTYEHMGASVLTRGLTDLRKTLDPTVPNWYRRPTDEDWNEGQRSDRRKPRTFRRKALFRKYGLGDIPGLTEPVTAQEWFGLRTDYTAQEVRDSFKKTE